MAKNWSGHIYKQFQGFFMKTKLLLASILFVILSSLLMISCSDSSTSDDKNNNKVTANIAGDVSMTFDANDTEFNIETINDRTQTTMIGRRAIASQSYSIIFSFINLPAGASTIEIGNSINNTANFVVAPISGTGGNTYIGTSGTINITTNNDNLFAGTFSLTFKDISDKTVTMTNGVFNLEKLIPSSR